MSLQMPHALALLTFTFCHCTQAQTCTAHMHLLYMCWHSCESAAEGARRKRGKWKRQNCDGKQVEGPQFILGGFEHEINQCLSRSVA